MKILFLTDNFPPESNAPATRTYEHCVEWVGKGAEVTVITCAPNYPQGQIFPGYKNKLWQSEMMDGIRVIRVWTYISPNRGLVRRILDYISFCIMGFFASLFVKTDVIVATSPQLFTAVGGYLASFFKRRPWVLEIRDLWPESIKAVGAMEESKLLKMIDRVVLFLYRNADQVVVNTDAFEDRIYKCGVPKDRIHVVKNGVHLHKYNLKEKDHALIKQLDLQNKFIIGYIGTHGMAHNLDFILDGAAKVDDPDIHFLFVGDGAMKGRLLKKAAALKLTNVTMLDPILKHEVPRYISITDVALVPLKKRETFKKVLPSKIFENAAMQKPILLGVEGEAQEVVESFHAGLAFEPENQADFLEKVERIRRDKIAYLDYQKGCTQLAKAFDRKTLALKMFKVLQAMVTEESKQKEELLSKSTQ